MAEVFCRGLPASWLNAWLAAVGTTVLDPRIRVRWTTEQTPRAVLCAEEIDPVEALTASWPDQRILANMPIAERWSDTQPLLRNVPVDAFMARVHATRGHQHSWTLSSTMTDLDLDSAGNVAHALFDPGAPRGIVLHDRLLMVHRQVEPSVDRIMASLAGRAVRVKGDGLGFDLTRISSQADDSAKSVDPVVEVLAFFGLALLPLRGSGTDRRIREAAYPSALQRGWVRIPGPVAQSRFQWPAWNVFLDCHAIDALLDLWEPDRKSRWSRAAVHAAWQSVQFKPKAAADTTRAYGAVRA